MKKLLTLGCLAMLYLPLFAATAPIKMAVFNCQSVDNSLEIGKSIAIREVINASIVNNQAFTILNHSQIDETILDLKLPANKALNESQMIEVGEKAGADKIIVSMISPVGEGQVLLSMKLIDVQQATIEDQEVKMIQSNQIFQAIPELTKNLTSKAPQTPAKQVVAPAPEKDKVTNVSAPNDSKSLTINLGKGIQFKMIKVEGGTFTMGGNKEKDINVVNNELPAHQVTLSSYYIAEVEVTNELYYAVMDPRYPSYADKQLPKTNVNQNDIKKFITLLNEKTGKKFSLPTEAQWEFAAKGGNYSKGCIFSGSNNPNSVAWHSGKSLQPVKEKNPNELGIYDMSGNAWEWCLDSYGMYYTADEVNPRVHMDNARKVVRGGSFWNDARSSRVTRRIDAKASSRDHRIGFRLCLPAE